MSSNTDVAFVHEDNDSGSFSQKPHRSPLPVPNVQELVRNDPLQVPKRYIRNEEDMPKEADLCHHLSSEIPIIDVSLLSKGDNEELRKFDLACKEWGFFVMINHGVETEVMQGMKDAADKFFELPIEEKNFIAVPSAQRQGYGFNQAISEEQILDWSDRILLGLYPYRHRKPEVWPPTPFKEAIEIYGSEVRHVAEELLRSLSLIMGMEKDVLLGLHQELAQYLSVAYYPSCSMPDKVLGLAPHSDKASITILMQDASLTGLQLKHEEKWVPVKPIPNSFVVNVGDTIEIWSNGRYKSIEHRVVTNESKARLSYASFFAPHEDAEIEPFDQMVLNSPESIQIYKKVRYREYIKEIISKKKFYEKEQIEFAKIGS
ncbi:protein SRG1-like [Rosa rugosa]|uniref:protein SRG1-like n=1 Tax=Rosa rugosa TaxID=74645 RepID=UPI002B404992|nr:protein SRG1-like [Rosa rugosa]